MAFNFYLTCQIYIFLASYSVIPHHWGCQCFQGEIQLRRGAQTYLKLDFKTREPSGTGLKKLQVEVNFVVQRCRNLEEEEEEERGIFQHAVICLHLCVSDSGSYLLTDTRVGSVRPSYRREPVQRPVHRQPCEERPLRWVSRSLLGPWTTSVSWLCLNVCVCVLQRAPGASSSSSTGCCTRPGPRRATTGLSSGSLRTW